ncbi:holin family protein [Paenibacillus sp. GCM10023252]|uniref:phage holin family protein n=1 Tax=Paenibacillus sp. GCM10023252 TaxID=3252649 RepID=UPI0036148926
MPFFFIGAASAFFGSMITFAFGMWMESMTFLMVAMGTDYVTGVAASIKEGKGLNSSFGAWGIARKGLMLLVILVAHRIDILLDVSNNMTMGAAIYFYIANELISITENYGRLGLPLPEQLRRMIEVLQDKNRD